MSQTHTDTVHIDITDVVGPRIADCRNIGIVPDWAPGGGRDLHVSNPGGSRISVCDYSTDEEIVSGNGWNNAMQALADHYQAEVVVACDPGVSGGKSGKLVGTWTPREVQTPAKVLTAPQPADRRVPAMKAALDAPLARDLKAGDLLQVAEGEFAPVLGVAITQDRQRVVITWGDQYRASKLTRSYNEVVLTADPATIRLTKAQVELLLAVQLGSVRYRPSNAAWAPSHAKRSAMFEMGIRSSNRTLAGNALDTYGLVAFRPAPYGPVELTEPARRWLAAHPS